MQFDIPLAMTWILFLALFPISFFWLRRAWRIILGRDFSEVALYRGTPPAQPEKYAPYAAAINLLGGGILVADIIAVVFFSPSYDTWSAVAGSTIWMKIVADFALSRHAKLFPVGKKT